MLYNIGINVLHINNGDKTLCGLVPNNKYPYELDVIDRIGLRKPLCQHCEKQKMKKLMEGKG